jgi:hypothetical protein
MRTRSARVGITDTRAISRIGNKAHLPMSKYERFGVGRDRKLLDIPSNRRNSWHKTIRDLITFILIHTNCYVYCMSLLE